jgi:1-acyl-sn-glycerol-3-phosphate acyltransferase
MNIIRTIIFGIFAFIAILMYGVCLLPSLFSYTFARRVSIIFMQVLLFITKHIARINYTIENEIEMKKNGVIIACNHCSAWETFFIAYYFKVPTFILKKSLFIIPILGNFLKTLRMIGIDRHSYSKQYRQLIVDRATAELQSGGNIAIFPQGTRVPIEETFNYEKYPYKPGITIFCRGHTICTVSTDARKCFGKSLFSLKKSGTIHVRFNDTIAIPNDATKDEIMQKVQNSIESGCKKILQQS